MHAYSASCSNIDLSIHKRVNAFRYRMPLTKPSFQFIFSLIHTFIFISQCFSFPLYDTKTNQISSHYTIDNVEPTGFRFYFYLKQSFTQKIGNVREIMKNRLRSNVAVQHRRGMILDVRRPPTLTLSRITCCFQPSFGRWDPVDPNPIVEISLLGPV